jgi:hypothetical protein
MGRLTKNKLDIIIDYSEFYDFELVNDEIEYYVDLIIDNSEFYDFELVTTYEQEESLLIDITVDFSEFYDFILTDDDIDENELVFLKPVCIDCGDDVISLDNEYGFLQYDDLVYAQTKDKYLIQYH